MTKQVIKKELWGRDLEEGTKQRFMALKLKQKEEVEDKKEQQPAEKSAGKHFPEERKLNFLKRFYCPRYTSLLVST